MGNDIVLGDFQTRGVAFISYNGGYTIAVEYFPIDEPLHVGQIKTECRFLGNMRYLLVFSNATTGQAIDQIGLRNAVEICLPGKIKLSTAPEGIVLQVDSGTEDSKKWLYSEKTRRFIFIEIKTP